MKIVSLGPSALEPMVRIVEGCQAKLSRCHLAWDRESLAWGLSRGRALGAWALKQDELIGFLLFSTIEQMGGHPVADIWCLATRPDAQGRGVMLTLMGQLQSEVAEVWLEVHEGNLTAIEFYQKRGFQMVGRRRRYYSDQGDALLFSKRSFGVVDQL